MGYRGAPACARRLYRGAGSPDPEVSDPEVRDPECPDPESGAWVPAVVARVAAAMPAAVATPAEAAGPPER
ncbi:MAG: hypothetical protein J2P16_05635, partial [Mycobacterium sp.]|nr:hypothetical protein [Mycobacterium sp.]